MTSPKFEQVPIDKISVGTRTRNVSQSAVSLIRQSVEEGGEFTSPIHVRKAKAGYQLIDGAHRLEAAQQLGLVSILARVWNCTVEQARFFEQDANLSLAHLTPLDLALSFSARRKSYQKLHPETTRGLAGGLASSGRQGTEMSFADYLADVLGVTPRQINRIAAAGDALGNVDIERLKDTPKRVTMEDLYVVAKCSPSDCDRIVDALSKGTAKTAKEVLKSTSSPRSTEKDPVENSLKRIRDAWQRASKEAQRRFVRDYHDELSDLLDGSDSGEV